MCRSLYYTGVKWKYLRDHGSQFPNLQVRTLTWLKPSERDEARTQESGLVSLVQNDGSEANT